MFEKNPGLKGLNLDYIRYPVSNRSEDTGYTVPAMMGFYESLGKEFNENQLADRTKMHNKFRQLFDKDYLFGGLLLNYYPLEDVESLRLHTALATNNHANSLTVTIGATYYLQLF